MGRRPAKFRRLELLLADPATAPHDAAMLVIGNSGDPKDRTKTAHVGHQWLGRYGKTGNGVVTVTTVWANERLYYRCTWCRTPRPGTSRRARAIQSSGQASDRCGPGSQGPGSEVGVPRDGRRQRLREPGRARGELSEARLPFVMALKPRRGTWAYGSGARAGMPPADNPMSLSLFSSCGDACLCPGQGGVDEFDGGGGGVPGAVLAGFPHGVGVVPGALDGARVGPLAARVEMPRAGDPGDSAFEGPLLIRGEKPDR